MYRSSTKSQVESKAVYVIASCRSKIRPTWQDSQFTNWIKGKSKTRGFCGKKPKVKPRVSLTTASEISSLEEFIAICRKLVCKWGTNINWPGESACWNTESLVSAGSRPRASMLARRWDTEQQLKRMSRWQQSAQVLSAVAEELSACLKEKKRIIMASACKVGRRNHNSVRPRHP